ncbi:DUF5133 domain-containing protein [Streptomyces sp. B3I8]|uniref:DUF5133 domain-containing protein n=1 Tax=Streptomyces sp. B3I8 TaxID=3042303 RepID=UPI0027846C45|nr:DUF5133 domain-containing protein [Streptomyces sp. B3I8]MDQ0785430.1 hypothetical protein [Streptomyces sp. B3I8]
MTTPTPTRLRELLARYATVRIALAERDTQELRRALREVTRHLCAETGTKGIREALEAADAALSEACCARRTARLARETRLAA